MSDVADLQRKRRAARRAQQARRPPELVMHAWIEDGQFDTAAFEFQPGAPEAGHERADMLIEAAWLYAQMVRWGVAGTRTSSLTVPWHRQSRKTKLP